MNLQTLISYQQGTLPDRYWYQLNDSSAMDNYIEQRLATQSKDEEIAITSEVIVK